MDIKEIKSLIQLLEETGLTEIEIEEHGRRVRLRKEPKEPGNAGAMPVLVHGAPTSSIPHTSPTLALPGVLPSNEVLKETEPHLTVITSPIVGTFYRSHQQGADAYVKVGDLVKKGQILCIVEAMKLMNEIESDLDGTVSAVCVEDKASVEFGQPLFKIDPSR